MGRESFCVCFNDTGFLFECKRASCFPDGVLLINRVTAVRFLKVQHPLPLRHCLKRAVGVQGHVMQLFGFEGSFCLETN